MRLQKSKHLVKILVSLCFLFVLSFIRLSQFDSKYDYLRKSLILNVETFFNQVEAFKRVIVTECNPVNFTLTSRCLMNLREFDVFLINQKRSKKLSIQEGCNKCLSILDASQRVTPVKVYYHTFWNLNSFDKPNRMVNLNILSYLATQNLCCTKLYVWVLEGAKRKFEGVLNKAVSFYLEKNFLEVKEFSIKDFCKSGFFKHTVCTLNLNTNLEHLSMVTLSDMVRFAVLDKYGG